MIKLFLLLLSACQPSSYDPICKVYRDELQFTGISISDNSILTVGHIGYEDYMFIEFHGENGTRFKVKGKVVKQSSNLTLISYDKPSHIIGRVNFAKISTKTPTRIDLKGWKSQFFFWYEGLDAKNVSIKSKIDSFIALENKMLVGIQSYQYGDKVYFINAFEIMSFLENK